MSDDPAAKMRIARRLAAMAFGVEELPPDADVEMSLDAEGNLRVVGSLIVDGYVPSFECKVEVKDR